MKSSILFAAMVACVLSAPIASAQEAPAPAKPTTNVEMDQQMSLMHENMKEMQQQMKTIRATTDPKERQKLMHEHMQTMQETMKTMRGMGCPMMGCGQKGGMGMGPGQKGGMGMGGRGMAGGDMMKRREMMEQRMDMMQMMMEQMMQHEQMMESMPAK
ncbi:MAG: hypothetical protein WB784_00375 [Rhodanobacteraceae bacterium]